MQPAGLSALSGFLARAPQIAVCLATATSWVALVACIRATVKSRSGHGRKSGCRGTSTARTPHSTAALLPVWRLPDQEPSHQLPEAAVLPGLVFRCSQTVLPESGASQTAPARQQYWPLLLLAARCCTCMLRLHMQLGAQSISMTQQLNFQPTEWQGTGILSDPDRLLESGGTAHEALCNIIVFLCHGCGMF